ncbi:hypothetical protein BLNAU_22577 [Blattamonas nauphoetae]|uniref:Uncharacterized protein n=1 Tax=Blattamonas nauphoetae TaxID=2049346 RepID=A0ABQ9WVR7_9EUKA|nr:hypothetical protein BLNAU_22577 [Blattamonas nauphoetae]
MTDPQISSVNETNILTPLRSALESNNLEDWTVLRDIFQQLPQNSFNSPLSQSVFLI